MMDFNLLGFDKEILNEISRELDSVVNNRFWSGGGSVEKIEKEFNSIYDMYSIACSSGGMALELIANAFPEINKIGVQSNTYFASVLPWLNRDKEIFLIGSNEKILCPSLEHIQKTIDLGVDAILLTHIGGYPIQDIMQISQYCKNKGILLFEDCAHSPLTKIENKYVGSFGDASILSFFPTKPIPAGEGGMVFVKNQGVAIKLKKMRDYGKEKINNKILHKLPAVSNARLNEFSAAIALTILKNYEEIKEKRNRIAEIYNKSLPKELIYQINPKFTQELSHYKYITFIKSNKYSVSPVYDKENQLYSILKDNNIKFKFIGNNPYGIKHICLPISPNMNEEDACNVLKECKF